MAVVGNGNECSFPLSLCGAHQLNPSWSAAAPVRPPYRSPKEGLEIHFQLCIICIFDDVRGEVPRKDKVSEHGLPFIFFWPVGSIAAPATL
jgi:hypothetical protein